MPGKIYLTGDKHNDFGCLSSKKWIEGNDLDKDDYLICLGDFGLLWKNTPDGTEKYWTKWLNDKPWTTLFLDGNHENFSRLNKLEFIPKFGGTVGKISDSIFHLKRGEIYNIHDKKFFCMGGALSIDKQYRTEWISWWKEEIPSAAEFEYGFKNLDKNNNKVDYILSHTCPTRFKDALGSPWLIKKFNDPTCKYLDPS
jgi:hypothetical protein